MLKIRMQRIGRINMPAYRIIVAEHTRSPKTGNIVEKVGTYNPKSKERKLDAERIKYWISVGAQPSPTVHNMLITEKIISGKKINVLPKKSPPTKTAEGGSFNSSQSEESRKMEIAEEKTAVAAKTAAGSSPDSSQSEEYREEPGAAESAEPAIAVPAEEAAAVEEKSDVPEEGKTSDAEKNQKEKVETQ